MSHFVPAMTGSMFFSHISAAVFWNVPLPARAIGEEVDVAVFLPRRAPRGAGVRGRAVSPALASVRSDPERGWRVTSPATTWAMLGCLLDHPYDLVAAADHLVRVRRMPGGRGGVVRPPLTTLSQLTAAVEAGRRQGVRRLRDALPHVRTGAASRLETWLRLTLVDGGLPEPRLDHDVYDDRGEFVACLDLAYPELRIAIEYDGDHHRTDPVQWARDVDRLDRLAEEGWRVVRVTRQHVFHAPGEVVRRVRAARAARGAT